MFQKPNGLRLIIFTLNGSLLNPQLLSFGIAEAALFPADWSGVVYNTIDAVTVVAAFYGVDVIPELFGFCYAAYNVDVVRMAAYGGAAAVPVASAFAHGRLAQYGKIMRGGLWRAQPQSLIDAMAERFGLINNRVATEILASDGLARRRAIRLMLRDDLIQAVDALPTPDIRVKFLEDFLDLSPKGTNFARHLVKKPELVGAWEVFANDEIIRALRTDVPHLERYLIAFAREGDSDLAQKYSRLIALRPSARALEVNEDILIDASYGLQSSKSGLFENVTLSVHSNTPLNRYLYTIDNRGINIGWEATPFPTPRGNIVHSNLSSEAYIGGEAWFSSNHSVIINAGSGRFGDGAGITEEQWKATIDFWEHLGYNVTPVPYGQRQL